jgi:hypothetical protein
MLDKMREHDIMRHFPVSLTNESFADFINQKLSNYRNNPLALKDEFQGLTIILACIITESLVLSCLIDANNIYREILNFYDNLDYNNLVGLETVFHDLDPIHINVENIRAEHVVNYRSQLMNQTYLIKSLMQRLLIETFTIDLNQNSNEARMLWFNWRVL